MFTFQISKMFQGYSTSFPHGAPQLQVLTISDVSRLTIPFGGDTPALRTLKLSYCPVPWCLFKLSSLTTLILECVPVQSQQSTEEFLAMLSRLQNLKHLDRG
ncbi:hypothetical protein L210DRAFT_2362617 [Boletus edulis BED1]|uniref:Uncharacterized protein n=1 Tax=Boletus edulis BED1 TaxID=1328754 RepID=A0AAD4BR91_BOLED|nr:hypothetical protein L210DRAFT_2362617 [Boletus edulis BED1]